MPKWNVLVVEDDYALQQLYKIEFDEAGLGITLASNGLEACDVLMHGKLDLVVTDVRMPEAGGDAVMDCIELNHLHVPVIVVSAFPRYREIFNSDHRVIVAYFVKPVDFQDLTKYVVAYLEGKPYDGGHNQPMPSEAR
jgi:DNA-binding NtrC family response regulator